MFEIHKLDLYRRTTRYRRRAPTSLSTCRVINSKYCKPPKTGQATVSNENLSTYGCVRYTFPVYVRIRFEYCATKHEWVGGTRRATSKSEKTDRVQRFRFVDAKTMAKLLPLKSRTSSFAPLTVLSHVVTVYVLSARRCPGHVSRELVWRFERFARFEFSRSEDSATLTARTPRSRRRFVFDANGFDREKKIRVDRTRAAVLFFKFYHVRLPPATAAVSKYTRDPQYTGPHRRARGRGGINPRIEKFGRKFSRETSTLHGAVRGVGLFLFLVKKKRADFSRFAR